MDPLLLYKLLILRGALQSLTGKYRGLQGNPCNENRDPSMRTGIPCNENRFFPVQKPSQGKPCSGPVLALYRIAVQLSMQAQIFTFLRGKQMKLSCMLCSRYICNYVCTRYAHRSATQKVRHLSLLGIIYHARIFSCLLC